MINYSKTRVSFGIIHPLRFLPISETRLLQLIEGQVSLDETEKQFCYPIGYNNNLNELLTKNGRIC